MGNTLNNKKANGLALLPFLVFIVVYMGAGLVYQSKGVDMAFYQFPSVTAMFLAVLVAFIMFKGSINEKFDTFAKGAANVDVLTMLIIYILAGAFATVAAEMGGRDATVNLGLSLVPVQFLAAGLFVIAAFMGTATGTSMGTISAITPIAVGVAEKGGLNMMVVLGAVIGGAMFGDNLSMISDTTIAATRSQHCEMRDKFRMNFFIAFPAAVLSLIFYGFIGGAGSGSIEVGAFDLFQIAPYIVVLVTALMGINVAVVLFIGILMTFIVGLLQGNVGFFDIAMAVGDGMADMFSISIVAILVSGVIGLVRYYGGIEWMIDTITKKIKNRKQAEYGIGILSGILSGAMVNNTIAIIVTCPIAKEIGSKYKIAPKRLASLVDIFACAFLAVMPHDGGMLMTSEMANISPFAILPYSVYPLFLIIATCITIQAGLLRTAEEKQKK